MLHEEAFEIYEIRVVSFQRIDGDRAGIEDA